MNYVEEKIDRMFSEQQRSSEVQKLASMLSVLVGGEDLNEKQKNLALELLKALQ